ncbi:MAG: ParA family protein [Gammaproteobacteria bacterium]|nr:ParA family protein [Gammaproteobacteria bacterium]MCB1922921.1 ParA family protein [Gammaproteobacteria bacterium]
MTVWSIANQKGGVGKTTTTVALGGLLAAWGFRTLMIDIDPHGSLTSYFGLDPDSIDASSYSLFEAVADRRQMDPASLIVPTPTEGLHLMPAAVALATLDRQSGRLEGLGLVLKRAVDQLRSRYDYILIDCPPVLGVLLINALAAAERLIVPVQTEFLAIKGLERMQHTLKMVTKARPSPLDVVVVPTFFDPRTRASHESLAVLRSDFADITWSGVVPIDTRFRDASRAGLPPAIYDPRARGVEAYAKLLEQLVQQPSGTAREAG